MSQAFTGQVRNGVVVFEGEPPLAEGTVVRVEPVAPPADEAALTTTQRLLLGWGRRAEAVAPPMPSDMAENHDHYAHGKPRE